MVMLQTSGHFSLSTASQLRDVKALQALQDCLAEVCGDDPTMLEGLSVQLCFRGQSDRPPTPLLAKQDSPKVASVLCASNHVTLALQYFACNMSCINFQGCIDKACI